MTRFYLAPTCITLYHNINRMHGAQHGGGGLALETVTTNTNYLLFVVRVVITVELNV